MSETIIPLLPHAFMAWCSVKKAQGQLYLHLLLSRTIIPLEQLIVTQLVKTFPTLCATQRFISVFTRPNTGPYP
jgi:hypothetical protein